MLVAMIPVDGAVAVSSFLAWVIPTSTHCSDVGWHDADHVCAESRDRWGLASLCVHSLDGV